MLTNKQKRTLRRFGKILNKHKWDRMNQWPEIKGLIHAGTVVPQKNFPETWRFYAIFDRSRVRLGEVYAEISRLVDPHGDHRAAHASYSPTGWYYSKRATVRIFRDRVVLIQVQGIDC